jgi:hypothetical protein
MKRKLLLGKLGILLASFIAFTGCDDVLAEIQKGLKAETSAYGIVLNGFSGEEAYVFDSADTEFALLVVNTGTKATGTLKAELTGEGREAFVLSKTELPSIEAGGSASFTVTPKTDLEEGTYTATVNVSGANNISASFDVGFTEDPEPMKSFADVVIDMAVNKGKPSASYILKREQEPYTIDISLTTANSPYSVTIDGGARTVVGEVNTITVGADITLTLKNISFINIPFIVLADGTLVLDGFTNLDGGRTTAGVTVSGGTFEMKGFSGITGYAASGVFLNGKSSRFTLSGNGSITYNSAAYYGGGVRINEGVFTMESGRISNNNVRGEDAVIHYGGGGVCLYGTGAEFYMYGGEISSNTATNGGGVAASGPFTMSGGVIKNNTARTNGGGVNIDGGEFTMTGGAIISDNNAISTALDDGGGGVAMTGSGGVFTMSGGAISGNTANLGGGVLLRDTNNQFTMRGGEISWNTVSEAGGGVEVVGTGGRFTMNAGSSIHNNTAGWGGGVEVYGDNDGIFTMTGGEIYGNNAGNGGGVSIWQNGQNIFNMSGGGIRNNTATYDGGGAYVLSGSTFNMMNGEITGNSASRGGGLYLSANATLNGNPSIGSYDPSRGSIYANTPNDKN